MSGILAAYLGGMRAEAMQLARSRLLVALTVVQAITFLILVTLFGLTGSRAPTAVVDRDGGTYARDFIGNLEHDHHSFAVRSMNAASAQAALRRGDLVAVITIPHGFSRAIRQSRTIALPVAVDNVDVDFTEDIQRALPAAIIAFAGEHYPSRIRLRPAERDLIGRDTGFIPYLVVSALGLDALVVAGILAAVAVAREFESGTVDLLTMAPVHPLAPLAGRVSASGAVALLALLLTTAIVVLVYGVGPAAPAELAASLVLAVALFSCLGAALGVLVRRTLPVTSLVFGLALPLYIDSGSLEPERFDGDTIWTIAHLSPMYYVIGILEHAFHGLRVTPEPVAIDFVALTAWGAGALMVAGLLVRWRVTP